MNHDRLANQVDNLSIQEDKFSPSREAGPKNVIAGTNVDENGGIRYVGYTFFKAQTAPGYSQTWKEVEKTRMNLRDNDLAVLVRKRSKKIPISDQYQSLTNVKRPHVDRLINDLRRCHPHFQWMCVYVREETRDVKGKAFVREYETTSMDVILVGKLSYRLPSETRAQIRDQRTVTAQRPPTENQPRRPVNGSYNDPRGGPNYPAMPTPPHIPHMPPGLAPFPHQHDLPAGPAPEPAPFCPPPQNAMRKPPHPRQGNWANNVSRSQSAPLSTSNMVHNNGCRPPSPDTRPGDQDRDARRMAGGPGHSNHVTELFHPSAPRKSHIKGREKRDRSPKELFGSEPDLVLDDTSSEEEIMMPDYEDDSEEDFSSRDGKQLETPQPWRGSLHRDNLSSQSRNRYRTHHRKEPTYPKDPLQLGDRGYRRYRDDGVVGILPGDGRHVTRRSNRTYGLSRQLDTQPRIIQQQPSSDDLDMFMNQARGRADNDIRSRMLKDWQEDLEQRKYLFKHKQMLRHEPGRMDAAGFPSRTRSLREPPVYHHGYRPRSLHYS